MGINGKVLEALEQDLLDDESDHLMELLQDCGYVVSLDTLDGDYLAILHQLDETTAH